MHALWLKNFSFLGAPYIIEILEDGISFRKIKSSISWSTIYNFHQKLVQFKIIENTYDFNVNKYLSNLETLQ